MEVDCKRIWGNCLRVIKDNIPQISYQTWFEPIVPVKIDKDVLTIQVPSLFFYEYLEEQYIDLLSKTLRKELGGNAKLEYNVVMDNAHMANQQPYTLNFPTSNKADLRNRPVSVTNQEKPDIRNPFVIPGIKRLNVDPQLNGDYSFENFVEGECNRLARSASLAVAKNPGKTAFNPLFLYGNSGLGKTHLAQSIGIEVKRNMPEKTVLYVNANKFQTQFTDSVRNNSQNDFLNFYQMIDVLIIDDVQEFAGKTKTQNTFFHIFNHLHQSGKQLILTCDKAPVELHGMEDRLLSRFKWGLSADLQIPDFETRVSILNKKIYKDGLTVPEEVVYYIASNVVNNVRELEGALISLLAQATLNKKEITFETAKQIIDKLVKKTSKELSIDSISQTVCDYFGLELDILQSKTRKREIVQARQIAMFFSKGLTNSSLSTIGAKIGKKDHATVLHACKAINNLIETDKDFKGQIKEIEAQLKS
ncbi:chromosomal replication initiator protein DnaA [Carboxylicivirga sediminis]|uniref:Chromosomal replication initiator protein DnaA n=1 Tax=Carboxylicivirga sediminis TaxID=2006564 RepID=A0A941F367_9BACT|nr:chromosomal replication initiator protein DnaA [Carboxylicivirga sediminis]MBR8534910.1 chromosomal replication initiator protein DnaA [Carboxylicivirga sediminis]